jgi:hypothetical protein
MWLGFPVQHNKLYLKHQYLTKMGCYYFFHSINCVNLTHVTRLGLAPNIEAYNMASSDHYHTNKACKLHNLHSEKS